MSSGATDFVAEGKGLSELERVVDTFIAPSKTFKDILRSASWWLPLLLIVLSTLTAAFIVDKQVGFDRVYENSIQGNARAEEQLNSLAPAEKAKAMARGAVITRYSTYSFGIIIALFTLLYALLIWGCFNFILGASTRFPQVFAVSVYALLPYLFLTLLMFVTVYFGGGAEAYDSRNPVGTNVAYYLPSLAPWLKMLLSYLDVIKLWSLFLMTLGMAIVARKSMFASFAIVGGLWLLSVVVSVGLTAAFS